MDLVGRVFLLRNAFIFVSNLPTSNTKPGPSSGPQRPSVLRTYYSMPLSSRTLRTSSLQPPLSRSSFPRAPQPRPARAHTLGKVGSRSRACWVLPVPPLHPFLLREWVSTRVNEMPRRRPLAVVSGRSINLQVQAATALCGRHSCPPDSFIPKVTVSRGDPDGGYYRPITHRPFSNK